MTDFLAVFAGGLLGSAHCIGMCGGIAVTIGGVAVRFSNTWRRQAVYTVGRLCTYAFLGAAGGFAGLYFAHHSGTMVSAQRVFSIVAGTLMMLVGFSALDLLPRLRSQNGCSVPRSSCAAVPQSPEDPSLFIPVFRYFVRQPGLLGAFLAGIATGFLPCGLVYAFLARSVAEGDITRGLLLMLCFGLGTAPAMLAAGCGATLLGHIARARVYRTAAVLVVLVGGATIWRGVPPADGAPSCCDHAVEHASEDAAAGT